jgi:hypothetical protein
MVTLYHLSTPLQTFLHRIIRRSYNKTSPGLLRLLLRLLLFHTIHSTAKVFYKHLFYCFFVEDSKIEHIIWMVWGCGLTNNTEDCSGPVP